MDVLALTISRRGRPIELLQSGPISLISRNAPSLATLMYHNVCFKKITKWSKASPSVAAATLAQAFKVFLIFFAYIDSIPYSHHLFQDTSAATGTSSVTFIL